MKYILKNKTTNKDHICEKVTINGFDYYVSDKKVFENGVYAKCSFTGDISKTRNGQISYKVIAGNNPSVDLPQVIDEVAVDNICNNQLRFCGQTEHKEIFGYYLGVKDGYNKSQETHPNSDEDMIKFGKFSKDYFYTHLFDGDFETCLKLWKSQQVKTIYYK